MKFLIPGTRRVDGVVAPFAGAWIEIPTRKLKISTGISVAPFAGAWIEIGIAVACT